MQPITPITTSRKPSMLRRVWRPAAGVVVAAALTAVGIAQPWHQSPGTPMHSAAMHASTGTPTTAPADAPATAPATAPTSTRASAPAGTPRPSATPKPSLSPSPSASPTRAAATAAATTVRLSTELTAAGTAPHLPWPSTGQASIGVAGVGTFGTSGPAGAVPMASVAKSMTAYLILKHHPLVGHANGPTIHVTAAEAAAFPHQVALQQSLVPVRAGEALTERQALEALMLASADNVAQILARWDAGSVPAFLGRMNATAKALGMTHTHYTDPSGYDAGTRSTVADQIKLADTAMRMASFERVVSTQTAVIPVAGRISNFNALLGQQGVVGIKTGSMSAAGGCLLFAARSTVAGKSVTILGTVLGQRSNRIGDLHQAFASSRTLLTAVHRAIKSVTVVHAGQVVGKVGADKLVATHNVTIPGWNGLHVHGTVDATVKPDTKNGAQVGTLHVGTLASVPVALHRA